ncbi:MAG: hypothetical protein CMK32_06910 [Porticoccaceae bacterium]|nr:hypothetical protein [Porticoccaceae bacterium]
MKQAFRRIPTLLLTLASPTLAYPEGAPAGTTGASGEPHCGQCHFGAPPVQGGITLTGLVTSPQPDRSYQLHLSLGDSQARIAGFQLSIRGPDGAGIGTLVPLDADLVVDRAGTVDYLGHAPARRLNSQHGTAWRFRWHTPQSLPASIAIHVAAVAGNDDRSPLGDRVYLLTKRGTVDDEPNQNPTLRQ